MSLKWNQLRLRIQYHEGLFSSMELKVFTAGISYVWNYYKSHGSYLVMNVYNCRKLKKKICGVGWVFREYCHRVVRVSETVRYPLTLPWLVTYTQKIILESFFMSWALAAKLEMTSLQNMLVRVLLPLPPFSLWLLFNDQLFEATAQALFSHCILLLPSSPK